MLKTINFNLQDIKDWAILDSGATRHFLVTDASATGISVATNPITATIPDGSKLILTHKREPDLPLLPKAARSGHVIPGMSSHSLVSVITLCNTGCRVVFEEWGIGVTATYRGKINMEGKKCTYTGLWIVPIKNRTNTSKRSNVMHVNDPNDTHFGVNQQVNDHTKAHFDDSNHFMANAI